MQILLETRCGCRRVVAVNYTIAERQEYDIPLKRPYLNLIDDSKPEDFSRMINETRCFKFEGRYDSNLGMPIFEEIYENS